MNNHTDGRWEVTGGFELMNQTTIGIRCPNGSVDPIAAVYGSPSSAETTANARLIAAAPDLLAALERTLSYLASYPGNGAESAYDQARAAIDKATFIP